MGNDERKPGNKIRPGILMTFASLKGYFKYKSKPIPIDKASAPFRPTDGPALHLQGNLAFLEKIQ